MYLGMLNIQNKLVIWSASIYCTQISWAVLACVLYERMACLSENRQLLQLIQPYDELWKSTHRYLKLYTCCDAGILGTVAGN
jgi:hypothetical protein